MGFSSPGGSVKVRFYSDMGMGSCESLPQLWRIADFLLANERDLEEASGSWEGPTF